MVGVYWLLICFKYVDKGSAVYYLIRSTVHYTNLHGPWDDSRSCTCESFLMTYWYCVAAPLLSEFAWSSISQPCKWILVENMTAFTLVWRISVNLSLSVAQAASGLILPFQTTLPTNGVCNTHWWYVAGIYAWVFNYWLYLTYYRSRGSKTVNQDYGGVSPC